MNANISFKLPALITIIVVVAVGFASGLAFYGQRSTVQKGAQALLTELATSRGEHIELDLQGNGEDLILTANSSLTSRAINEFSQAWDILEMGQTEMLQQAYITDNPYPIGERHMLDVAQDGSIWSSVHAQIHPEFRAIQQRYGYYDIFLFDLDGNLIYSVFKESDFATNMKEGEWKNSGLAAVFDAASKLPKNEIAFEDYSSYGPSNGAQASFIAGPVFTAVGERVGVIAYQLPSEHISNIANDADGLGETGEIIVVGAGFLLRTNSRFSDEEMIMKRELSNAAVRAALEGETGVVETVGPSGKAVYSAYMPLNVFGQQLALVAEQDKAEIYASSNFLGMLLLASSTLVVLVVSGLGVLLARSLTQPLKRAAASMEFISNGSYDQDISDTARGDEIGIIANTLEKLKLRLVRGEMEEAQNHFSAVAFASSSSAIMMADKDMKITSLNPALEKTLQHHCIEFCKLYPDFEPKNVLNTEMDFYHPPEIRERVREMLRDPDNLPYTASINVGDSRFTLSISMVQDEDRECMGYVVEWIDVTEEYLRDAVLNAININQVKAEFAMDNTLLTSNELFCTLVGQDLQSLVGKSADEIFSFNRELASERGNVFDRLKTGETIFGRFDLPLSDGRTAVVEGGFSLVTDASGKPIRVLLLGLDVTEARRSIEEAELNRTQMVAAQGLVVENLRNGLRLLSEGDLTANIDVEFDEEHEQLRHDFNTTGVQLLGAMQGVVENADLIRGEASEIATAAEDLSARTERQAATLEETASALDELTSSVRSAADGATRANEIVENARDNAEASGEVVREAVGAMSEIENSSKQISKITGVIDDIAFQTNLLALNAGVEAARAGEAGRGFAVVASEVRALAQRSSDAAREINELISASGGQVKRGVELVDQTGKALAEIVKSVSEINQSVSEIAVSSREQSSGLAEINEAVNQLDQVTQQNAAMFEETTAASHALTREAETLTETMGQFKTGSENVNKQHEGNVVSSEAFTTRRQTSPQTKVSIAANTDTALALDQNQRVEAEFEDDWDDF